MRDCKTTVNGLTFYTPDLPNNDAPSAYEWYEKATGEKWISETPDGPDGVYVLTPDGEHLLSDLNMTGLLALQDEMTMIRASKVHKAKAPTPCEDDAGDLPW